MRILNCSRGWLILAFLSLSACGGAGTRPASDAFVEGVVIEEGTNTPIPGAIVLGRWQEIWSGIFDATTVCVHVETAVTDEQGRFQLPLYKGKPPNLLDSYKPGYERSEDYYRTKAYVEYRDILKRFGGTREKRLEYLKNMIGMECGTREDYAGKISPLYRAIYEEARALAVMPADRKVMKTLHYSLDVLELGSKEADRRLTEGVYDR